MRATGRLASDLGAVRGQQLLELRSGYERHVSPDGALQRRQRGGGVDRLLGVAADQGGPEEAGGEGIARAHPIHHRHHVAPGRTVDPARGQHRRAGLAERQRDGGRERQEGAAQRPDARPRGSGVLAGRAQDLEVVDKNGFSSLIVYAEKTVNNPKNPDGYAFAIAHTNCYELKLAYQNLRGINEEKVRAVRTVAERALRADIGLLRHLNVANLDELSPQKLDALTKNIVSDFHERQKERE